MTAEVFLDSNVLVYAALGTGADARKRQRALDLIDSEDFGISAQVLQEFFITVVKKARVPLTIPEANEWIEQLIAFPCLSVDHRLVRIAIEKSQRYSVSYWDAAIIAAAEALRAKTIYSEDLSDGQVYGSIRVVNPFGKRQRAG